jgi:hypothetical protein
VYKFLSLYEADDEESSFSEQTRQSNTHKKVKFTALTLELRDEAIPRYYHNYLKKKERLEELKDISKASIK